jgi:hypothetical protein
LGATVLSGWQSSTMKLMGIWKSTVGPERLDDCDVPVKWSTRRPSWLRIASTERLAGLALIATLAISLASLPAQVASTVQYAWPVIRLWPDLDAQYRLQLGDVPYAALARANELVPTDAGVLLVTPGVDVRHLDYTTFHRALYFLAPRPVWWLTPARPDGTWESRWWISGSLTREQILSVAAEKGVHCLLMVNVPETNVPGEAAQLEGARLVTLPGGPPCLAPNVAAPVRPAAGVWRVVAATAAMVGLALFGMALSAIASRQMGYKTTAAELMALGWPAGAAMATTGMLWLGGAGVGLRTQVAAISVLAFVAVGVTVLIHRERPPHLTHAVIAGRPWEALVLSGLVLLICIQFAGLMIIALGRPLDTWDSWVNWAMKARVIFTENGFGPALYADPSRVITHLDYPLLLPLLQAWVFTWLGVPDDRLAALPGLFFYLTMIGAMYAGARRWGARPAIAALPAAALACLPGLADLAAIGFADLPVAALVTVAAIYLVDWLRTGARGPLLAASLAAGLLPWTKREGWILLAIFALAALLAGIMVHRGLQRVLADAAIFLGGAAVLAGPWLVFTIVHRIPNPDYDTVSAAVLAANAGRFPFIVYHLLLAWGSPKLGLVWPAAMLAAGWGWLHSRQSKMRVRPVDMLLLGPGLLYTAVLAPVYLVAAHVPYQQHVVGSVSRLAAQVAPLPIIWLALRMHPQSFAGTRA